MRKVTLKKIEERKTKKAALNNSWKRAANAEAQRQYTCAYRDTVDHLDTPGLC